MAKLSMNQSVITWARGRLGQQVGRGECWDLADQALRQAGAHSSDSTQSDADYKWGADVKLADVIPGDVLQFRDYSITTTTTTTTTFPDGSSVVEEEVATVGRPHHTALVDGNSGSGWITILEQNVPPKGKRVQSYKLATRGSTSWPADKHKSVKHPKTGKLVLANVATEITIEVSGTIWAYRPEAARK